MYALGFMHLSLDTLQHFKDKEVGEVDALKMDSDGVTFHVWGMKESAYTMQMMSTYGTSEEMQAAGTRHSFTNDSGELTTKQFNYTEVYANHYCYRHQVDDHNNRRHSPVSLERTWATKYWPHRCFAHFLAVTEVNTNLACGYFSEQKKVLPTMEFRRILSTQMLENEFDHTISLAERRKRRKSTGGGHVLVPLPEYRGRWKPSQNRYSITRQQYQKQICHGNCGKRVRRQCTCTKGLVLCSHCFALHLIESEN